MAVSGSIAGIGLSVAVFTALSAGILRNFATAVGMVLIAIIVALLGGKSLLKRPVWLPMVVAFACAGGVAGADAGVPAQVVLAISLGAVGFGLGNGIEQGLRAEPADLQMQRRIRRYRNAIQTGRFISPLMIVGGVLFATVVLSKFAKALEIAGGLCVAFVIIATGIAELWLSSKARPPHSLDTATSKDEGEERTSVD